LKKILFSAFLLFGFSFIFAQENILSDKTLTDLLTGYLQNDLELQKLTANAKSASLLLEQTNIENGISLNLSTGSMILTPSSDGTSFTLSPALSASVAKWNNTTLSLSTDLTVSNTEENQNGLENLSLTLSTQIIGTARKQSQLENLKAKRQLILAKRNVENRALSAEKEFYTDLKELLNEAANVLANEQDLYEEEVEFKKIQAQGYAKTSSSYRTQALKVRTANRTLEESKRNFVYLQNVLATKCGKELTRYTDKPKDAEEAKERFETSLNEAWAFLPSSIPYVEAVELRDYKKENYTKIESATYDIELGKLTRDAQGDFSLDANAGYTFKNTQGLSSTSQGRDTIDAGASLSWKGLSLNAGVSFPFSSENNIPFYKMSLGFSPSQIRLSQIQSEQNALDEQIEQIALKDAEEDFRTQMVSQRTTLSNLNWAKMSDAEELELYTQLEKDNENWFKQGIINESDYKASQVNKKKAEITCLVNAVEFIIYNDTIKLLFVNEEADEK
jgi:hypothetical protein